MTDTTVHQAFAAVMADVRVIAKGDRNRDQGYNFRGIDAVLDEVGPMLRKHGVFIVPATKSLESERYETKKGAVMRGVTVEMIYTVFGPKGDSFTGGAYGEAADSGDKAVSKAESVAYRTFLIQALSIPTGDPDPDAETHERVPTPVDPKVQALDDLAKMAKRKGIEPAELNRQFVAAHGLDIREADADTIRAFAKAVNGG